MNFEISLLPALGGYWLLTHFIPTRTEALRQSGYHIAFRSAVVGLVLFVLAYLILHSVKDTQELVITTDYATAFHARSQASASRLLQDNPNDFRVVIPRSEIVSARLFDPELHQMFQEAAD